MDLVHLSLSDPEGETPESVPEKSGIMYDAKPHEADAMMRTYVPYFVGLAKGEI
jgi:hypothetical protein